MTTWYSDEMANVVAVPSVKNAVNTMTGKMRVATFNWAKSAVAGEAGDVVELVKLPAGRVRLLGNLSCVYHNMTTGSQAVDIGWKAYTDLDGAAVAADPNGLDAATSFETAGFVSPLATVLVAKSYVKEFESQAGVVLILTAAEIIAALDSLYGHFVYVTD